jgi:hypothetical protein
VQPKVHQQRVAVGAAQHNVLQLEVAVHDGGLLPLAAVEVSEPLGDVHHPAQRERVRVPGAPAAAAAGAGRDGSGWGGRDGGSAGGGGGGHLDARREREALHELLHNEERARVARVGLGDAADAVAPDNIPKGVEVG